MTLKLLWEEWRATHPDGMSYVTWCRRFRRDAAPPVGPPRAPSGGEWDNPGRRTENRTVSLMSNFRDLRAAAATLRADRVLSPESPPLFPRNGRRSREHIGRTPMPIHATINERTLRRTFREQVKGKRGLTVFDRAP